MPKSIAKGPNIDDVTETDLSPTRTAIIDWQTGISLPTVFRSTWKLQPTKSRVRDVRADVDVAGKPGGPTSMHNAWSYDSRYAFTDSMMSTENKNILQVIDKRTLEVVAQIKAEPGQTLAHVEFTRDGRYALASLWEMDGALLVIDAQTLEEVKRIPAKKPVGKYNVWNKISRSEGTSH